jgi:dGTPase
LGPVAARFLDDRRPSLEAQICNIADEIAYNNHDVDDGLRSGLITAEQLNAVSLYSRHAAEVVAEFPSLPERRRVHETIRRMIDAQVTDLLAESGRRIATAAPSDADAVRHAPPLISFSAEMQAENRALKAFLRENLYRHYQVLRMTYKARRIIGDLFGTFMVEPRLLPEQYQALGKDEGAPRAVADYIAGMTDRYAMKEHRRLFSVGDD